MKLKEHIHFDAVSESLHFYSCSVLMKAVVKKSSRPRFTELSLTLRDYSLWNEECAHFFSLFSSCLYSQICTRAWTHTHTHSVLSLKALDHLCPRFFSAFFLHTEKNERLRAQSWSGVVKPWSHIYLYIYLFICVSQWRFQSRGRGSFSWVSSHVRVTLTSIVPHRLHTRPFAALQENSQKTLQKSS